jgi:hypothetical protein
VYTEKHIKIVGWDVWKKGRCRASHEGAPAAAVAVALLPLEQRQSRAREEAKSKG